MKVLIACEQFGEVRNAFAAKGHFAVSCDLEPSRTPGNHIQGDVRELLKEKWDLIIAHPPCTYLSNSGVCWLWNKDGSRNGERWQKMKEGAEFFRMFLDADCPRIAVENPIIHKYAKEIIGRGCDQIIQPYEFGHAESKATCLWLKGLPPLMATANVLVQMWKLPARERQRLHYLPPSKDRAILRAKTFPGIAEAMSSQWC